MRIHSLERREHGECACPRLDFVWDHNNKSFYQLVGWKCIIQLYFKAQLSNLNDLILYNIFNIVFSTNKVITQTTVIFFSHRELGNTSINMNIYKSQGISWCCLFIGYTPPPHLHSLFLTFYFLLIGPQSLGMNIRIYTIHIQAVGWSDFWWRKSGHSASCAKLF